MSARVDPQVIEDLLSTVTLSSVISASVALKRRGREYVSLCPFHSEKSPSFTVNDDKGFFHCFGCGAHGRALDFLMRFAGLSFPDALQQLAADAGRPLDRKIDPAERARLDMLRQERQAKIEADERAAFERSGCIFKAARRDVDVTSGGLYLNRRRITIRPASLVYAEDADLLPEMTRKRGAVVIAMHNTETKKFAAIQRVYINADGSPVKIEDTETGKQKSLKLSLGYVQGAAAMLSQQPSEDGTWGLAEGFETAAACIQIYGVPTWAAISSGNMQNVKPPAWAKRANIYADNDANGAGFNAAMKARAAWIYADRFIADDIKIYMVDEVGKDHADLLLSERAA